MRTEFVDSLASVTASDWDGLWADDYPFVRHAYLLALEASGCTTAESGWQPHHLLVREGEQLIAAMPLYLKAHSYGEYVFDWSWADAYHRYGRNYYPKLLNAIPFTPATGPRFAVPAEREGKILAKMLQAVTTETARLALSSFHCLFPSGDQLDALQVAQPDLLRRSGCQFHWFNQGYRDFDDFLQHFNSRKRKALKRERRRIGEQAIEVQRLTGRELSSADRGGFYELYRLTYLKRSGHQGYLNRDFFERVGEGLADNLMMVKAFQEGKWVAAALYFYDQTQLYGRYWGAVEELDGLHFECCYYQGIEFAIEHGLTRFDPGAQGEHKIQRGFTPVFTASLHRVAEPPFAEAIAAFLCQEREHMAQYCEQARSYLPFHQDEPLIEATVLTGKV